MKRAEVAIVRNGTTITGGELDSITTITNPVDVSGSVVNIGNSADIVPLVPSTDAIYLSDGTALAVKFANGSASSAGDNSIVAAVPGKQILVMAFALSAVAAVNAVFKSDTGGGATQKWPTIYLSASGSKEKEFSSVGHFGTASGKALNLSLSGALAVEWAITYVEM